MTWKTRLFAGLIVTAGLAALALSAGAGWFD
jgi:hypothetical protein